MTTFIILAWLLFSKNVEKNYSCGRKIPKRTKNLENLDKYAEKFVKQAWFFFLNKLLREQSKF